MEPITAATTTSVNKEIIYALVGFIVVSNLTAIITVLIWGGKIVWKIATMDGKIKAAHNRLDEMQGKKTKYHENGEEK